MEIDKTTMQMMMQTQREYKKSYYIKRGNFWFWTFLCERLLDVLANQWTWGLKLFNHLCIPRQ